MVDVSVVIPTYKRPMQLAVALEKVHACNPAPAEVLVHVDAGDRDTAPWLRSAYPAVRVISSNERAGPGGGRNKLMAAASHEIVVSFDDDSYPCDPDFFTRVLRLFEDLPDAAVLACHITHRGQGLPRPEQVFSPSADFIGCGVGYRRADFLKAGGYVSLPVAYGMEEVDLAIRLLDRGRKIYYSPWLRVFHDTDLAHHASPAITAGSIRNQALLVFLRYPIGSLPYGVLQVLNRIIWLVRAGRWSGIVSGIAGIPSHLWRHRRLRAPVAAVTLRDFRKLRRARPRLQQVGV